MGCLNSSGKRLLGLFGVEVARGLGQPGWLAPLVPEQIDSRQVAGDLVDQRLRGIWLDVHGSSVSNHAQERLKFSRSGSSLS